MDAWVTLQLNSVMHEHDASKHDRLRTVAQGAPTNTEITFATVYLIPGTVHYLELLLVLCLLPI